jgi:hypothetical protein
MQILFLSVKAENYTLVTTFLCYLTILHETTAVASPDRTTDGR